MRKRFDTSLLVGIVTLVAFGAMMVYSSSSIVALTGFSNANYFFNRTLLAAAIGAVALIIGANIPSSFLKQVARYALPVTLILLVLVLLIGREINGATRWIILGPLQFQPSEVGKITFAIYVAAWLAERRKEVGNMKETFIPLVGVTGVIGLLLLLQPDFGTFTVYAVILLAMFWVAGMTWKQFLLGSLIALVALAGILSAPYRRNRLAAFFNPEQGQDDVSYHVRNLNLAVGTGGWFGLGFGQSRQKRLFLPEPHTDSIYAVTVEELGFVISLLIFALYCFVLMRAYLIAVHSSDAFNRYLAIGITTWFAYQAFLNLAAILQIVPLKGLPIPFISYGGTNLIVTLFAAGVLLSLSRETSVPGVGRQYGYRSRTVASRIPNRRLR